MFATWAPKLYTYYADNLDVLLASNSDLRQNFPRSVWAAAEFSFGPKAVTRKHRDYANLPSGWRAITALGDYDPVKGGHAVLWELNIIIEFPPGWTLLLPTAAISVSNTRIGRRETRASFTQYSDGSLFRRINHGDQNGVKGELTDETRLEIYAQQKAQCQFGLALFSTLDELRAL